MKTKIISILALNLVLFLSGIGSADLVDISVATDKPTYQVGEDVKVYVSAYNPGLDPVILTFTSSLEASYWMNEEYYWHENKIFVPSGFLLTINPKITHTWELIHGPDELSEYPLNIGTHNVIGMVGAYELQDSYLTEPVEFEVIPEPASLIILTTGSLWIFRYSRKRNNC